MGAAQGITAGIGMGMDMYAGQVEAGAKSRQNDFEQRAAGQNAASASLAARNSVERGQQQEMASRAKYGALRGDQTTALAASGVTVDKGSSLDLLANTQAMSDYDASVIRNNAAREAWGYRAKATEFKLQKNLLKQQAEDDKTAAQLKMGGSLLSGMTSMSGGYSKGG
jgi:hypothetical protein